MAQDTDESTSPVQIIAMGNLGPGNLGVFGPKSEREAASANDYAQERYCLPPTDESHCMDDGFEGHGIQLPGNRALTEMLGSRMDSKTAQLPQSRLVVVTVEKLMGLGRPPFFHGDNYAGKGGCALNQNQRPTLKFNAANHELIGSLTYTDLRLLGIEGITADDIYEAIMTGGERAEQDGLWDADAEEIFELAAAHGAPTKILVRDHALAGHRKDFSPNVFDNGLFRREHQADDGKPLGAFSITFGAYLNQLLHQDGFSPEEAAKKLLHASLVTNGILKLAESESAVGVSVR